MLEVCFSYHACSRQQNYDTFFIIECIKLDTSFVVVSLCVLDFNAINYQINKFYRKNIAVFQMMLQHFNIFFVLMLYVRINNF